MKMYRKVLSHPGSEKNNDTQNDNGCQLNIWRSEKMDRNIVEGIKRYYEGCIVTWEDDDETSTNWNITEIKVKLMKGFVKQLDRILSSK